MSTKQEIQRELCDGDHLWTYGSLNVTEDDRPRRRWCARMLTCGAEELRQEGFAPADVACDEARLTARINGGKT